jgi:hypothetical protein
MITEETGLPYIPVLELVQPLPKETRPLEEACAKAMKAVGEKFPKDADIGALYT